MHAIKLLGTALCSLTALTLASADNDRQGGQARGQG